MWIYMNPDPLDIIIYKEPTSLPDNNIIYQASDDIILPAYIYTDDKTTVDVPLISNTTAWEAGISVTGGTYVDP